MPCPVVLPRRALISWMGDHQRIGQQHGPADAEAKLRAGLAVGADAGWIVVRRPGDQPWPENADQAPDGTGFDRLIVFSL